MPRGRVALKPLNRIVRFAVVGVSCFLVQLGLIHALDTSMHLYYADVIAFLLSAQLNFLLSMSFTWGDRRDGEPLGVRWVKFNANALVSVTLVNATVFYLLVQAGLPFWVAMALANLASSLWTFLVNHFFVFKTRILKTEILEQHSALPQELPTMNVLPINPAQAPSVALFMPAYNEAENVGDVVARAHRFFDQAGIAKRAVIVVDDGSSDGTAAALDDVRKHCPVEVVTHPTNYGYGRALRSGFEAALATGCEWVAFCDSDGQFNPADMALLLVAAYAHDVHAVLGVRAKRADNLTRRMAGRGWHGVSRMVLKYQASDVDCGFKLLHRSAIESVVPQLQSDFAAISPELLARLHRAGTSFVEVPVPHYPRIHGTQTGLQPKVVMRSFVDLYTVRRELTARRAAVPSLAKTVPVSGFLPVAGQEAV